MVNENSEAETQARPELPLRWKWVELGALVEEHQTGFATSVRDPHGVVQLRMNNVDTRGNLLLDDFIRVPGEEKAGDKYLLKANDVVFNNTNSTELVGKSALFRGFQEPVAFSNHFTRLRTVGQRLAPEYLSHWLVFQWKSGTFAEICNRWIGQSAVKPDKLFSLSIPLPPLEEQKRIAARLSEEIARVEKAREAAKQQLKAIDALPTACLREAFESEEARSWPKKWLGEVCEIQLGKMLSPASKTGLNYFPYLRNANVQWGRFDLSGLEEMDFNELEQAKFALRRGDLLVCEGGEPGRAAVWEGQVEPCFYQKALHRLRSSSGQVDPYFLMYRFQYGTSIHEFDDQHSKSTIAHLPATRLSKLLIGLPDLEHQQRMADVLKEQMAAIEVARQAAHDQLQVLAAMSARLLARAFSGQWSREEEELRICVAAWIVRRMMGAYIGRTILVKMMFLAEAFARVPLNGIFRRRQFGPFDGKLVEQVEQGFTDHKWFRVEQGAKDAIFYRCGDSFSEVIELDAPCQGESLERLEKLVGLLEGKSTEDVEIIGTLYAAWNDLLAAGKEASFEAIFVQVQPDNWHARKEPRPKLIWRNWYDWLKKQGVTPDGTGPVTKSNTPENATPEAASEEELA